MSRIVELLAENCSEGVKFKTLGEIVQIFDSLRKPVTRAKRERGKYPYYGANGIQDWVSDYIFDGVFLLLGEDGSVVNKDGSPVLTWAEGKIWVNNHAHVLAELPDVALLRYVYFYLQTHDVTHLVQGVPPKINQASMRSIRIPVPPLEVQREIVRVLDTFTELAAALAAELTAELEARQRQYEYYRDTLLGFSEKAVQWATLGEIGTFRRGRRFTKDDYVNDGIGCIHYGDIYTQYGTSAVRTVSHVRTDMASTFRFAKPGDIIIAAVGETVEDVGKAVAWLGPDDVAVHDDCFIFHHSMNPKFVSYYLQTKGFHTEKNKFVARAKVKRLSGRDLAKLTIPVPSLDEQVRIVGILDQFDALVNDLSIGLPAELKARRRQYAHYRDRLLSFRESA